MIRTILVFFTSGLFAFPVVGQASFDVNSMRSVNTPYDEQNPVLSPDGNTLYFTVRGHPLNVDGKRDAGDIWFSTWADGRWSEPVHAGPVLNDRSYNAVAGFSFDGSQMFLLSHYDVTGVARTQGISVSRKTGTGWSMPENIFIPYFQNKSSIQSGHVTSDGSVFVYSAETYGSRGVDDLYVSIRGNEGKWSEPQNLGSVINTQFQELCPSLSADGRTLFFSSNGRKGLGSFDVFVSERLDDTYMNWSEPVNLGPAINTEGRELFYRSFERHGVSLFTTTKDSDGYGDIRSLISDRSYPEIIEIAQLVPQDTVSVLYNKPEVYDESSVRVYGKVTDARTGESVRARVRFDGAAARISGEATNGGFSLAIPIESSYTVRVEAAGYVSTLEKIDLVGFGMRELEMNFQLQPIEVGTTVNLKSVLFIQSQPELLPESYPELDLVVAFMKSNPQVEIELAGHTDNRGSYRQLLALSQKRVNRVKEYMVSKGIDKKRITGKGYGGSKPVASNDTEAGRVLNRRVEFMIRKS